MPHNFVIYCNGILLPAHIIDLINNFSETGIDDRLHGFIRIMDLHEHDRARIRHDTSQPMLFEDKIESISQLELYDDMLHYPYYTICNEIIGGDIKSGTDHILMLIRPRVMPDLKRVKLHEVYLYDANVTEFPYLPNTFNVYIMENRVKFSSSTVPTSNRYCIDMISLSNSLLISDTILDPEYVFTNLKVFQAQLNEVIGDNFAIHRDYGNDVVGYAAEIISISPADGMFVAYSKDIVPA